MLITKRNILFIGEIYFHRLKDEVSFFTYKPFFCLLNKIYSMDKSVTSTDLKESFSDPVMKPLFNPHIKNFGDSDFFIVEDKRHRFFIVSITGIGYYLDIFIRHG